MTLPTRNMLTIEDAVLNLIASSDIIFYLRQEMSIQPEVNTKEIQYLINKLMTLHMTLQCQIRAMYIQIIKTHLNKSIMRLMLGDPKTQHQYPYLAQYTYSCMMAVNKMGCKLSRDEIKIQKIYRNLKAGIKQFPPETCQFDSEFGILASGVQLFKDGVIDNFFSVIANFIKYHEESKGDKLSRVDPSEDLMHLKNEILYFFEYDFQKTGLPAEIKETADELERTLVALSDLKPALPLLMCHRSLKEIIDSEKLISDYVLSDEQIFDISEIVRAYYATNAKKPYPAKINHAILNLSQIKPSTNFCFAYLINAINRDHFCFGKLIERYIIDSQLFKVFAAMEKCVLAKDTINEIFADARRKDIQMGNTAHATKIVYYTLCFDFYFQRTMRIIMPIQAIEGYLSKLNQRNPRVVECLDTLSAPIRLQKQITSILNGRQKAADYLKEINDLLTKEESFMDFFKRINKKLLSELYQFFESLPAFHDETDYQMVLSGIKNVLKINNIDLNSAVKTQDLLLIEKMVDDYTARASEQQAYLNAERRAGKQPANDNEAGPSSMAPPSN